MGAVRLTVVEEEGRATGRGAVQEEAATIQGVTAASVTV